MNEFSTMTNLGGYNALIIMRAEGIGGGDSMEPPNRRGGLGRILREGKEGNFFS